MLTIRPEQIEIFRRRLLQQFEDVMLGHLTSHFERHPLVGNEAKLRNAIRKGIASARGYGVVCEFDVCRFLEFTLEYGTGFHSTAWASRILNDATLSGSAKMDRLDDYTVFVLRS
jgi:hypothetical protein